MFECNCGKNYKTEKGLSNHLNICEYKDIDLQRVYKFGLLINETNRILFHAHLGKVKKLAKSEKITLDEAREVITAEQILKYRKSLWDILEVWKHELVPSEYRIFLKWVFKTYKDISLLSLRNTLTNSKIIYRFNMEHSARMIESRIDDSLIFLHNKNIFSNDFEFVDAIISGHISMYYVLFNDWLAEKWFGRLDLDLQKELEYYIEIASKTILDRISQREFSALQKLANSTKPKIYEME